MVNLEQLGARGLRAYEVGRLRTAAKIALVLLPVGILCLREPGGREACACSLVLLVGAGTWLRWRDRRGFESVTTGLLAGALPLLFALGISFVDPGCRSAGLFSLCTACSVLVGGAAGIVVARREIEYEADSRSWIMAGAIAVLAASLGCVRFGAASVAGVVLGMVIGRFAARRSGPVAV